jgi:ubiquinol-cytochrome c reductase cytochrome c1 subunit
MRITRVLILAAALGATAFGTTIAEEAISLPKQKWSFDGPFGTFDRASAQRGAQVYKEVCANCHSLKMAYYRDLGGIGMEPGAIAAIAASVSVPSIADDGSVAERPALPSDHFRSPFANEKAARSANGGALPPDLSVITKARDGGEDYIYALLTGYGDAPASMKMGDGMNYNKMFAGNQIGMPRPLNDGQVEYGDGTKASTEQMARDVVTFLSYIANPEMEARKRLGVKMVLFLVLMTGLTYAVKRKIWADVDH